MFAELPGLRSRNLNPPKPDPQTSELENEQGSKLAVNRPELCYLPAQSTDPNLLIEGNKHCPSHIHQLDHKSTTAQPMKPPNSSTHNMHAIIQAVSCARM